VIYHKGGKVRGLHLQRPHRLGRDHARGAHAYLESGALAHQVAGAALGQESLPAVLVDADPRAALNDDDHVVGRLAFAHDRVSGREPYPGGQRLERSPLGRIERLPEAGPGLT